MILELIKLNFLQICYISDCCYFYEGGWAIDIEMRTQGLSAANSIYTEFSGNWQSLATTIPKVHFFMLSLKKTVRGLERVFE